MSQDLDEKINQLPSTVINGDSDNPIIVVEDTLSMDAEKPTKGEKCLHCLNTNKLTLVTITGVILGIIVGVALKLTLPRQLNAREVMYISFVGDVFLRMLKALIIPLIVSTLVTAIANIDLTLSGRIALRTVAFYLTTTFAAVVIGIILVATIKPGESHDSQNFKSEEPIPQRNVTTVDTLLDLIKNLFPPNVVQACVEQERTLLTPPTSNPNETDLYKWNIGTETAKGTNILGLVVVGAVVGIGLAKLGEEAKTLTSVFNNLTALALTVTGWIIWFSPIGILFLVAAKILEMEDIAEVMKQMGLYFATVVVGLTVQGFIFLPLLYFILTRKSPFKLFVGVSQALATAFGTSSSHATLPLTIKCLEENCGLDSRVVRFALPVGAAINMDGTALYEAVAAIFIAQVRNLELGIGNYIAISVTATAAAIGAAGIPQAGLVTMVMVLDTIGLPAEDITLILAVDWLLDRFRTVVNVLGDCYGAGIVAHRSKKDLEPLPIAT